MPVDVDTWRVLLAPASAPLIAEAAQADPGDPAALQRLRRHHAASPELVHAALQLAVARRKARRKWPEAIADRLLADPVGVEMATSWTAGRFKARTITRLGAGPPGGVLLDLCCGIGGDALALRAHGLDVIGVDSDQARVLMCGVNARCPVEVADVLDARLPEGPFLLDPARRTDARSGLAPLRVFDLEKHQPGPAAWRTLVERRTTGVIKLGPGADVRRIATVLPPDVPLAFDFVSERSGLTQLLVWTGDWAVTAPGSRRAVIIRGDTDTLELRSPDGPEQPPPIGPLRRYLLEPDPSFERAGLLAALCARSTGLTAIHPGLGLLTSDSPAPVPDLRPALRPFEVLASMPWIEKHVRTWLRDHDAGIVQVKTRGRTVDPDALQVRLRGTGERALAVFILRFGRSIRAIIARRAGGPDDDDRDPDGDGSDYR